MLCFKLRFHISISTLYTVLSKFPEIPEISRNRKSKFPKIPEFSRNQKLKIPKIYGNRKSKFPEFPRNFPEPKKRKNEKIGGCSTLHLEKVRINGFLLQVEGRKKSFLAKKILVTYWLKWGVPKKSGGLDLFCIRT